MAHKPFESITPLALETVNGGGDDGNGNPVTKRDLFTTGGTIGGETGPFTTGGRIGGDNAPFTTGGSF